LVKTKALGSCRLAEVLDPAARELSFLKLSALLVDPQWHWRKNQALEMRLKNAKLRTTGASKVSTIAARAVWTKA
jgi:hypothetical protein